MGKYLFTLLFLLFSGITLAQTAIAGGVQTDAQEPALALEQASEQNPEQGKKRTLLTATRADSKLNETILHTTAIDYTLPPEIMYAAAKCRQNADECYFSLKTYEDAADKTVAAAANVELAVLSMQRGLVKQALKHINRAAELNPEDPFAELTRGWFLLAQGKYKKAQKSFEHLFYLTADFEYVSSAKLGSALCWYFLGKKEKAAYELQYLYTSNPYMISFVSYMLGKIASEKKRTRELAQVFLQQALTHDATNYEAEELLAQLAEKDKDKLRAWQYYATLYSLDPQNKALAKKIQKYTKTLGDKSKDYLFYLRLDEPIVNSLPSTPSEKVKMALYANREQIPQSLRRVSVIAAGNFRITDQKRGEVLKAPSYIDKIIEFNPETRGVDFKNAKGHVEFSSVRPFALETEKDDRTILIKDVQADNIFATDLSVKEIKGRLVVVPTPEGVQLINEVNSEDLLPALLATQVQDIFDEEALKALAVVLRSSLAQTVTDKQNEPYHITDNDNNFQFKGINLVFQKLLDASQDSAKIRLTQAQAGAYQNGGVVGAKYLKNSAEPIAYTYSPANVSKYMLSSPPADLYSRPSDPTRWSAIKWLHIYDAKDVQNRVAQKANIGALRALTPTELTPNGRILAMRFEGSKGTYEAHSPQEVMFLLSAGTMRSNWFDIIPVYKGKNIKQILVRGYDTGLGNGLCLQGAEGLAKTGHDYKAIIKYYFPEARILNTQTGTIN